MYYIHTQDKRRKSQSYTACSPAQLWRCAMLYIFLFRRRWATPARDYSVKMNFYMILSSYLMGNRFIPIIMQQGKRKTKKKYRNQKCSSSNRSWATIYSFRWRKRNINQFVLKDDDEWLKNFLLYYRRRRPIYIKKVNALYQRELHAISQTKITLEMCWESQSFPFFI